MITNFPNKTIYRLTTNLQVDQVHTFGCVNQKRNIIDKREHVKHDRVMTNSSCYRLNDNFIYKW